MKQTELIPAEERAPVPAADAGSIMAVISRAASDPSVDVDKLERLLEMYERISARSAQTAFAAALAQMQPELPEVTERGMIRVSQKDGKAGHETPYALFEDINAAVRPILHKHGFAVSFRIDTANDAITVTGVLSHTGGHSEQTSIALPADKTGSKNSVQAIGSSVSYGKRYTLCALLNITTRGEDDDGNAAGAPAPISEEQLGILRDYLSATNSAEDKFCKWLKVEKLEDLPEDRFGRAVAELKKLQKKQAAP